MKKSIFLMLCLCLLCACGRSETVHSNDTLETSYNDRIVLTVGGCGNVFMKDIAALNASQDEFYFVAENYKIDETGEKITTQEAVGKLIKSVNDGNGPDLIAVPINHLTDEELADVLVDLYPYIDSDPELKRDDILPSVRTALEVNDRLCVTASAFTIYTMAAKTEMVGDAEGWNIKELQELSMQNGGAQKSFSYICDGRNFLEMILEVCGRDFFEDNQFMDEVDTFSDVLTYCKQMGNDYDGEQQVQEAFFTDFKLSNYMDICYAESLLGGEVSWIGVPSETKNGHAFWDIEDTYAMTACCGDKEAAWSFLRSFFMEDYQYTQYVDVASQKFPTNCNALLHMEEEAMQGTLIDNDVNTSFAERCVWDADYHALTQNETDSITDMLMSCDKIVMDLYNITVTYGMYFDGYFADSVSLEETMDELTKNG